MCSCRIIKYNLGLDELYFWNIMTGSTDKYAFLESGMEALLDLRKC